MSNTEHDVLIAQPLTRPNSLIKGQWLMQSCFVARSLLPADYQHSLVGKRLRVDSAGTSTIYLIEAVHDVSPAEVELTVSRFGEKFR